MSEAIDQMLKRYDCTTQQDYKNALKEIIQELALLGLWRSKFFEKAAFYGGTALRILFGLNRFSEDLDFSLLEPEESFDILAYQKAIETELQQFGFNISFSQKVKNHDSAIVSAFLKANTLEHMIMIDVPERERKRCHFDEQLKIKLEVDTNPPPEFKTTVNYLLQPSPFSVKTFSEPDLFAGKLHALLCRSWKTRVKGRDWYDFVWFIGRNTAVHMKHLEERMRQSGHYTDDRPFTVDQLQLLLHEKIDKLDISQAKEDIFSFIKDRSSIEVWSAGFFHAITDKIVAL
ncbi:MAG: nucleotidyl transferase AbiEii/AbiGii toxin family protein [Chlamydiota bacterium]|nr:nucleotidyl transferase AbiEii/AbiGii toxin family protein [Chlamydiota bacterium]